MSSTERTSALSTITVTQVDFDVIPEDPSGGCPAPPAVPAYSSVGVAVAVLLVLLVGGWLLRSRLP